MEELNYFFDIDSLRIEQIKQTLGEDTDRLDNHITLLKEWIKFHPFIPKDYDENMLTIFLRCCKYNLDATKQKLEAYFVNKKRYPDYFIYHDFSAKELATFDSFYVMVSKNLTPEGYTAIHFGFRDKALNAFQPDIFCKLMLMFGTLNANRSIINAGNIVIANVREITPAIAAALVTPLFKRSIDMIQNVFPFRLKHIYVTYLPGFAVNVVNIVKLLFKEKLRKRISMEKHDEYMRKCVPDYCIPEDLGGTDVSVNEGFNKLLRVLENYKPWFKQHEQLQVYGEISKDVYAANGINEEMGTQGSFRKLDID